jgi:RNA polymerase sigma-70 factor (ECF subfamily)
MNTILANRLARSCAYSTQAPEWEEFVRLVTPVVSLAVWRVASAWGDKTNATVTEIVQDVFLKLCEDDRRILRDFEDRGNDSFLKLLRVVSASVATDYFRRTQAEKRGGRVTSLPLETPAILENLSHSNGTEALEWPTFVSQIGNLLRRNPEQVTERDRTLFWLYYRQGLTAKAISRIPAMGLGSKGVESALSRLTRLLQEAMQNGNKNVRLKPANSPPRKKSKGFPSVIAIDTVKRR